MKSKLVSILLFGIYMILALSCSKNQDLKEKTNNFESYINDALPSTRWWWFATEIKKEDIKYQLDWFKKKNFGGVEIAWVYPLYRYQRMYSRKYNREYPKDTTAQEWLSPEWIEAVKYAKDYSDSIGLRCDFTYGSAWPVAASNLDPKYGTKIYKDSSFRQLLTFAWTWPDTQLVINHLDSNAFNVFSEPIEEAFRPLINNSNTAFFTDSWEIKLNDQNKIWTDGFEIKFQERFGYDIIPFMDIGIDSFPDVRYDYMKLLEEMVIEGFYKPFVIACRELNAISRVQCLASPTDVMTTYSMVDIPETEALLNNPNYSRIVSSSAALSSKAVVSSESFTCMYGFPSTYLRNEQIADLKLLADALFAQGVNFHIYHGSPYNPKGSDTIEFFATTYFGPGGSLEKDLAAFNSYVGKVSKLMQEGRTYSNVAVYLPYEDGIMKGAYPKERRRVWVWGEYEMRYVFPPKELEGYHPLWINRKFLEEAEMSNGNLMVGDLIFNCLYIDVDYMDFYSLKRINSLAKEGLKVYLKNALIQPGYNKNEDYSRLIDEILALENVTNKFEELKIQPLIEGQELPDYWSRVDGDGNHYVFLAQNGSKEVEYPMYSGQSFSDSTIVKNLIFNINSKNIPLSVEFKPYQSQLIRFGEDGNYKFLDIEYTPEDPIIRPKEKQKTYF